MTKPATLLAERSRRHQGGVSGAEALASGLTPADVLRMARQGWWHVLYPGIYVASGTPLTMLVREAAALAYLGPLSALSHASAARHQKLELPSIERVFLSLPSRCALRSGPGLVVMRTRHMVKPVFCGGLRVTPVNRTLVDLSRDLERPTLLSVVADALRRKHTTIERILAAAEGLGGRAGLADLRVVCAEVDPLFESGLEEEAYPHLLAAGLDDLVRQLEVHDLEGFVGRLDFACERLKLAIEIDGWGHHSNPAAKNRDARRDRRLAALGWTVARFTTDDVRRGAGPMVAELRAIIGHLSARVA